MQDWKSQRKATADSIVPKPVDLPTVLFSRWTLVHRLRFPPFLLQAIQACRFTSKLTTCFIQTLNAKLFKSESC